MTDQILKRFLDDLPSCPVCMVEYNITTRAPMILGCAHTICLECLPRLFQQNQQRKVICPTCRTHNFTTCHRCDCPGFMKNFELLSVVEKLMTLKQELGANDEYRPSTSSPLRPIGAERQTVWQVWQSLPSTLENHVHLNPEPQPPRTNPINALLNWAGSSEKKDTTSRSNRN